MGRVGKKTPRSQTETGPPEPVAEPAVAPASEVPEATAEQDGDDDLGGDAGAAAASSAAPKKDVWRADDADPEEAGGAMAAAPAQTMEAAGIFAPPADKVVNTQGDLSMSESSEEEEEEEAVAEQPIAKPSGKPKGKGR